jgi:hypothetical protein
MMVVAAFRSEPAILSPTDHQCRGKPSGEIDPHTASGLRGPLLDLRASLDFESPRQQDTSRDWRSREPPGHRIAVDLHRRAG